MMMMMMITTTTTTTKVMYRYRYTCLCATGSAMEYMEGENLASNSFVMIAVLNG
jgi:hypothetical protein